VREEHVPSPRRRQPGYTEMMAKMKKLYLRGSFKGKVS